MTIDQICSQQVVTVSRESKITQAARLMRQHHVGDVVVLDERGSKRVPCGILTDRDITIAVVAEGINPDGLTVGEVMQSDVMTGNSQASVAEIVELMKKHGVRRIPIVDEQGALAGIVTADDLVECFARELQAAVSMLEPQRESGVTSGAALATATADDMLRRLAADAAALAKMISREQTQEMALRRLRLGRLDGGQLR